MDPLLLQQVRSFNRAVTLRTGALNDSYLGRGRPLGQPRLLFEIDPDGSDIRSLRARLGLDSGYVSRLLKSLEAEGLVAVESDDSDRRRKLVTLTAKGRAEHAAYDALSDDLARSMLDSLSASQRDRLVAAMREVEKIMTAATVTIEIEAPHTEAARACLGAYLRELDERFEGGFDQRNGNALSDESMTPPAGWLLIARLDGRAIGCGALKRIDDSTGEIKRMWIAPEARGLGMARRLLEALENHARQSGMTRVVLDTNRTLKEAQALYRKTGYREIARYNDNPYADFFFEKELGG